MNARAVKSGWIVEQWKIKVFTRLPPKQSVCRLARRAQKPEHIDFQAQDLEPIDFRETAKIS